MTDLNNKNTEKEIIETDDMLISFVLNECGMNGSVMLIAKDVNGVDVEVVAVELIESMLHNLPDYVLDKLETVSSDAELRDALSIIIDQVKSLSCFTTVKAVFDNPMSELMLTHKLLKAEMLMENDYFGNEIMKYSFLMISRKQQ